MRASPDLEAFAHASTPLPMFYELGGGGPERARIVCCFLGCDERPFNPLLTALPAVIHLSSADDSAPAGWLGTLLSMAAKEAGSARAGAENVLARLSERMFVETIRQYLETLPSAQTGWLAGLRDPMVGHALAVLHRAPHESWTVERLARVVGLSRSVLAERFTLMLGQPPMHISPCGACSSRPGCYSRAARWRRPRLLSATNQNRRSAALSRSSWARPHRGGGDA
jgi:AraC-like DNA-binding protein